MALKRRERNGKNSDVKAPKCWLPDQPLLVTVPHPRKDKRLSDRVDAAAAEFGFDRSGLLAVAARQWLATNKVEPAQTEIRPDLKPSREGSI